MLPSVLSITEGSLTFLLLEKGRSVKLLRVTTLWFAVLVDVLILS